MVQVSVTHRIPLLVLVTPVSAHPPRGSLVLSHLCLCVDESRHTEEACGELSLGIWGQREPEASQGGPWVDWDGGRG